MHDVQRTDEFDRWLARPRGHVGKAKILARTRRLELGNPGDVRDVGEGISELRLHFGPGYRVYYEHTGRAIVLLLCGGDKSTQDGDIRKAQARRGTKGSEMTKVSKFDVADYLDNPEVIAAYLNEAFESGDTSFISAAIGDVARAKGMASIAAKAGVSRESLYKSLSGETSPAFETVRKVLEAADLKMVVEPAKRTKARQNRIHSAATSPARE